ncbi:hypothetical protein AB0B01_12135 [Streptomyces sp. NPDC044571]|uniref:class II glutamine amidotransferase n=1 Tax=Streptomyces sp. NPDC044571 TaxID=3155371 RepID=UPI0034044AB2
MVLGPGGDGAAACRVCVELGGLAVERGWDAAGLALTVSGPVVPVARVEPAAADTTRGGWRIVKRLDRFDRADWPVRDVGAGPGGARVVLAHTRFPTQGRTPRLVNTSPLAVGQLIGTHNGDVDVAVLRARYALPSPVGETDTEVLFQALDGAAGVREAVLEVLRHCVGRAALVWVDRRFPELLWLARTAISPLAVAFAGDGTLYWASNPGWFGAAARAAGVRFSGRDVWLVPEGTLLVADLSCGRARLKESHSFVATARPSDERLLDTVAHLGFSAEHRQADRRLARHLTRPDAPLTAAAGVGAGAGVTPARPTGSPAAPRGPRPGTGCAR